MSRKIRRGIGEVVRRAALRQSLLDLGHKSVPLIMRVNPRARRLILKVEAATGEVVVVAPSARALRQAPGFVAQYKDWVAAKLAEIPERVPFVPGVEIPLRGRMVVIRHMPDARRGVWYSPRGRAICVSGEAAHVARRVHDWLKDEARKDLSARTRAHAAAIGGRLTRVSVRDTKSRWGSCTQGGVISFSWRLIFAPPAILDYVAAHEAVHLKHMDHGPRFQKLLNSLIPHSDGFERWLDEHGPGLHRYGAAAE